MSQASVHPAHINLRGSDVDEFAQFMQQYHPMVDERSLVPKQVNMLRRVYGISSDLDATSRDSLTMINRMGYSDLHSAFFNMDDRTRSFIGSNFPQLDELVNDYLVYKGLLDPPKGN